MERLQTAGVAWDEIVMALEIVGALEKVMAHEIVTALENVMALEIVTALDE